jgi:hypothetical protein
VRTTTLWSRWARGSGGLATCRRGSTVVGIIANSFGGAGSKRRRDGRRRHSLAAPPLLTPLDDDHGEPESLQSVISTWRDGRKRRGHRSPREEGEWQHEDFLGDECGKLLEVGKRITVDPIILSTFFMMWEQGLLEIAL